MTKIIQNIVRCESCNYESVHYETMSHSSFGADNNQTSAPSIRLNLVPFQCPYCGSCSLKLFSSDEHLEFKSRGLTKDDLNTYREKALTDLAYSQRYSLLEYMNDDLQSLALTQHLEEETRTSVTNCLQNIESISDKLENLNIKNPEEWQRFDQVLEQAIQEAVTLLHEQMQ
jgi:predicted RNA-binding Zn-ribbon protein involved in translation (DUF1610 family)